MNELVEKISAKAQLSEDKAKQVVEIIVEHLKSKLPSPIGEQVDNAASGGEPSSLGSLLSKKSA